MPPTTSPETLLNLLDFKVALTRVLLFLENLVFLRDLSKNKQTKTPQTHTSKHRPKHVHIMEYRSLCSHVHSLKKKKKNSHQKNPLVIDL